MSTIISCVAPITIAICITYLVVQIVNMVEKKRVNFTHILLTGIVLILSVLTYMVTTEFEKGYQQAVKDAQLVEDWDSGYILEFADGEHYYDFK